MHTFAWAYNVPSSKFYTSLAGCIPQHIYNLKDKVRNLPYCVDLRLNGLNLEYWNGQLCPIHPQNTGLYNKLKMYNYTQVGFKTSG